MHIVATIVKATELFAFAEQEEIAYNIKTLIYTGDAEHSYRHRLWFNQTCFTVGCDEFDAYWANPIDWVPEVELMVRKYMAVHNIEVLVIVTGTDAHVTQPLTLPRNA
jgi:hypothetical protein